MNIEKEMLEAIQSEVQSVNDVDAAKKCAAIAEGMAKDFDIWKDKNRWVYNAELDAYVKNTFDGGDIMRFEHLFSMYLNEKK